MAYNMISYQFCNRFHLLLKTAVTVLISSCQETFTPNDLSFREDSGAGTKETVIATLLVFSHASSAVTQHILPHFSCSKSCSKPFTKRQRHPRKKKKNEAVTFQRAFLQAAAEQFNTHMEASSLMGCMCVPSSVSLTPSPLIFPRKEKRCLR